MYYPSQREVEMLIRDFKEDFGAKLFSGDARRMLELYDELQELFAKYGVEELDFQAFPVPESLI